MTYLTLDPTDPRPLALEALALARTATAGDARLSDEVEQCERRLLGPLRVAVAGKVKAGKSTLVNAFLADELAPTDAGECTRVTTWFQHGDTPATRVVARDGTVRELPFRRAQGQFVVSLGGYTPEEVARVEVDWPSPFLTHLTVIDTPGLDSLTAEASDRTSRLLLTPDRAASVDAVLYLMRHRHAVDLSFIADLARDAGDELGAASTLVVLSRADELGGGRIDSLLAARDVATAYAAEPLLQAHTMGVVPVAGLLALGARMLRQDDFDVLQAMTDVQRDDREAMLVSADRFVSTGVGGTPEQRAALVRRLGVFGIRLGTALIRTGAVSPAQLAVELEHRSGLADVESVLSHHFLPRSRALIARNTVTSLEAIARLCPDPHRRELLVACDRFRTSGTHGLTEMALLLHLRSDEVEGLTAEQAASATTVLGGNGTAVWQRLGIPEDAPADRAERRLAAVLASWQDRAADPTLMAGARRVVDGVLRTLDLLAVTVASADPPGATPVPPPAAPAPRAR